MKPNFAALITALSDEQLESFVSDWLKHRVKDYHSHERWSGAGDMGRDVVGYETANRHEGPWDNFQCKQLSTRLSESAALIELGKIFMHAAQGDYSVPRAYTFVAPRGVVRNVQSYIAHPSKFKNAILTKWVEVIAPKLVEGKTIPLSTAIRDAIDTFDFKQVYSLDAVRLAGDDFIKPVLVKWFDEDPGAPVFGKVPETMEEHESAYVGQLVDLYRQRTGLPLAAMDDVFKHADWGIHLHEQRVRYFQARDFDRHLLESTPEDYLARYREEVYYAVVDVYQAPYTDGLERVRSVMVQAAGTRPTGVVGRHASAPIMQGTCHQFANENRLPWKR